MSRVLPPLLRTPIGLVDDHRLRAARCAGRTPVFLDDGIERLVEIFAVAEERFAQHAFLHRAHLAERAVAAAVAQRRPRLEPMDTERFERESQHELGAFLEDTQTPERRSERESPFGGTESRFGLTHLEDADRRVLARD